MTTGNEIPEQPPQDAEVTSDQGESPSLWRRAANTVGRGLRNAGQEISDVSRTTGQVIQRSGEVLAGADIRRFDEFTEAVTRVVVGLHHDQTDIGQRVSRLEQEASEIRQFQAQLIERLSHLEQEAADNRQFQEELAKLVARLDQERRRRESGGFLRRIWRALFG